MKCVFLKRTWFSTCFFKTWGFNAIFKKITGMKTAQRVVTCSKLTLETLEQGVKYVQSEQ